MRIALLTHTVSLLCCSVTGALGWGAAGHEIVATIAQMHLRPHVLPTLCSILELYNGTTQIPCHLASVATWADQYRGIARWTGPLHYIGAVDDNPPDSCQFPGSRGWDGQKFMNVLSAVRNATNTLENYRSAYRKASDIDETANKALKFLIHFVGDMHQPLHLTGRDRGGNALNVTFDGRETNLHALWDDYLIAKAIRKTDPKYNEPLPFPLIEDNLRGTIYDPYVRRIMWTGVMHSWVDEKQLWLDCPPNPAFSSHLPSWMSYLPFRPLEILMQLTIFPSGIPKEPTDDQHVCPFHWASMVHDLNCQVVWPKATIEPSFVVLGHRAGRNSTSSQPIPRLDLDTPEYAGVIEEQWIVEKLLAQAGVRLAGILNLLFDPEYKGVEQSSMRVF